MVRAISLGIGLFGLWLLLSGYFEPLLLAFGILSCLGIVAISSRMNVIDQETVPLQVKPSIIFYWIWLGREIAKANLAVARTILSPKLALQQSILRVPYTQRTDVGMVTFANSITLTPGTITIETEPGHFIVHALTEAAADKDALADMDRRVTAVEAR